MPDDIAAAARASPSSTAVEWRQERLTYSELDELVWGAVASLRAAGVRTGDRVALWAGATPETVVALWAIPRVGASAVPLNTRWMAQQAAAAVADTACRLALTDATAPDLGVTAVSITELRSPTSGRAMGVDSQVPPFVVFTSGSAGRARGVIITSANIAAAVAASQDRLENGAGDRWLGVLPLFHVGGLSVLWRSAAAGGTVVLDEFDPERTALRLQGDVGFASVVPAMLRRIVGTGHRFKGVRAVLVGGGPVRPDVATKATAAGLSVCVTYGMTEMVSQAATARPGEFGGPLPPLRGVEIRAVDDTGQPMASGQSGLIEVRGPMLSPGYVDGVAIEGWLRTPDRGSVDEAGRVLIEGRADHAIISGGEKVQPEAIEAALEEHPAVSAAAVYGVPDPTWEEAVAAAVVPEPGTEPTEYELEAFLSSRLASFEVPRVWRFLDKLPRTSLGKVDRGTLAGE